MTNPVELERELFRAIDGFVIARIEEVLGNDDPGISIEAATSNLQQQIRILCNTACSYKSEPTYGLGPIRSLNGNVNFDMKDLFGYSDHADRKDNDLFN